MYRLRHLVVISILLVSVLAILSGCQATTPATTSPSQTTTPVSPVSSTTVSSPTTSAVSPTKTSPTTTTPAGEGQYGGTLRIIWSNSPASGFGWGPKIFGGEGFAAEPAMEPLLEGKFLGGYEPRLATDYKITDDGLSITFYLRKGVKFHDGTDFNADAVKFNVDAMIKAGKYSKNVLSCDVIDPYTVKINLQRFENVSLGGVAGTVIASPSAVQKNGEDWAAIHAVGTGPFKQVSYEPDVKIRLERFDGYWGQKPYLDAIEGTFISDPVTQIMAMKAGMGDATHSREAKTTYQLVSAGFKVLQNYMGMVAITPNSRDKNSPFYDERVRMALEYAIDKKAIVDTFGYGFWEVADQMPVPGQNGYLADIVPRSYNPAKAKELLKQAGFPNGFNTNIYHGIGDSVDIAAAVQADLAEVGIKAEIVTIDWSRWGQMRQQGWDGLFLCGSGLFSDSNQFLYSYFREGSTEMYSINRDIPGWKDLIEAAITSNPPDPAKTQAAMRVIFDKCLWIPIKHHGDNYNYTDKVHGLNFGTYGQWGAFDAEKVWLSK